MKKEIIRLPIYKNQNRLKVVTSGMKTSFNRYLQVEI